MIGSFLLLRRAENRAEQLEVLVKIIPRAHESIEDFLRLIYSHSFTPHKWIEADTIKH